MQSTPSFKLLNISYIPNVVGARVVVVGHGPFVQGCVSLALPLQGFPPCAGRGLVQVLVQTWVPAPQVVEHEVLFHAVQPPSTKT